MYLCITFPCTFFECSGVNAKTVTAVVAENKQKHDVYYRSHAPGVREYPCKYSPMSPHADPGVEGRWHRRMWSSCNTLSAPTAPTPHWTRLGECGAFRFGICLPSPHVTQSPVTTTRHDASASCHRIYTQTTTQHIRYIRLFQRTLLTTL